MCGIVGQVNLRDKVQTKTFDTMLSSLAHRGPDGQDQVFLNDQSVALGHTRLAIIDLSDAGRQPMHNEDQSVWLTFNGEIYNYQPLRKELQLKGHKFASHTDSEVIIHAYEEWGTNCLNKLNGIFAFGIWDTRNRRLFLARDHIGIKPLYYNLHANGIAYASQPRALLLRDGFTKAIDFDGLDAYLAYGYVPQDQSIFREIKKLPPAHYLIFENGKVKIDNYWKLEYQPEIFDFDEAVSEVRKKVVEVTTAQMVSDVPIGVFLSGGIDSSAVASIAQNHATQTLNTFTIGFLNKEKDERTYAQIVADALHTNHHTKVLDREEALEIIAKYPSIYDEPLYDSSFIPTYYISQFAKDNHNKVILAGDGGDELFAGYKRYDAIANRYGSENSAIRRWRNNIYKDLGYYKKDFSNAYFDLLGRLPRNKRNRLIKKQSTKSPDLFKSLTNPSHPEITAAQHIDFHSYLVEDILAKVDRASMASGIEVRVPLLDRSLVELAFRINVNLHYQSREKKSVLKAALSPMLPQEILSSRKKGFSPPLTDWLGSGHEKTLRQLVCDGSLVQRGAFSHAAAMKIMTGKKHAHKWLLTCAELWARKWLENETINQRHLW